MQSQSEYTEEYWEAWGKFASDTLKSICEMPEEAFGLTFGLDIEEVDTGYKNDTENYYFFQDNGADILAVAHLDTVVDRDKRTAKYVETEAGWVIHSGALDDRLGAYTILDLLPMLDINVDVLLTVGEESGCSTAEYFQPPKEYNWMIEFDRGGSDVVMYQYDDTDTAALVRACGAKPNKGIFSDICYLEHLEIKGFNWGVGYKDYHSVRGHAYLDDYMEMIGHFMKFHAANAEEYLPHEKTANRWGSRVSGGSTYGSGWSYASGYGQSGGSTWDAYGGWVKDEKTGVWTRDKDAGLEEDCEDCKQPYWYCDCDFSTVAERALEEAEKLVDIVEGEVVEDLLGGTSWRDVPCPACKAGEWFSCRAGINIIFPPHDERIEASKDRLGAALKALPVGTSGTKSAS